MIFAAFSGLVPATLSNYLIIELLSAAPSAKRALRTILVLIPLNLIR
jgi:hypothetical protein